MTAPSTLQSASLSAVATEAPFYRGYRALSTVSKEIRLLDIGPDLVCSLRHADLDDKPSYFALSYYWGARGEELPITVNGEQVRLRKTLHRFFEVLQKRFSNLTVWVDVICINQRDRVEQSHQVSMMGDIYRQASSVYAWLGDGDADSDFAFIYTDQWLQAPRNTDVERTVHRYLEQILLRPYFTRSWIIQECSLDRSTSVVCGNYMLEWDLLRLAFRQMAQSNETIPLFPPRLDDQVYSSLATTRFMRVQAARMDMSTAQPSSIFSHICNFSYTQCADPSDKIYAFRALSFNAHKLQVDYTQPTINCIFQVLSISYHDRMQRRSYLVGQAIQLLRCTDLTESQMLLALCPSPADVLIESFTPLSILSVGLEHDAPLGPLKMHKNIPKKIRRSFGDVLTPPGNAAYRFAVAGGGDSRDSARAYLVIDIDLRENRIVGAHCLQIDLLLKLINISHQNQAANRVSMGHEGREKLRNLSASCLSDLERMKPVQDILKGRLKLCRKARQFRKISSIEIGFWRPSTIHDTGEGYKVGVHMSRIALVAFLACSIPGGTCLESLVNYSRDHPPTPDEAECTCTEDLLFGPG